LNGAGAAINEERESAKQGWASVWTHCPFLRHQNEPRDETDARRVLKDRNASGDNRSTRGRLDVRLCEGFQLGIR
jgi:hypothetical protein